ncbi:Tryptophan-rich antigen (Pv-fam-a) [Plasmodium coatneyi]|uniref:Tryptophan-rich antigen (Pv-fam-a) n=1 Tax=Plasmodium coatneyi TaxID=208452 RepID=A0A1B1E7H3_9APIC|nr:Tryptophan-rich antigen (Pv-fam-a) [Plasmodium coatneyi]ANQ10955.1 Tryptophan-rich antigen (Pv-fam-a) [Plasmodium coatneyi]
MDLSQYISFMSPLQERLKNAISISKEKLLPQIDPNSVSPYIYVILFTLAAVLLFINRLPQKRNEEIQETPEDKETYKEIALEQGLIEKSEELKKYAWSNWFTKLQTDWNYFNASLENQKKTWFGEKDKEWNEFLDTMQNKWTHYNANIETEFESNILKNSKNWNEKQWENWIKSDGKEMMEMSFHKWMGENYSHYNAWIIKKWEEWKNDKIRTWLLKDWRRKEFDYWHKYKSLTLPEPLFERAENNWNKWNRRLYREKEQWKEWVAQKYEFYQSTECQQWKKWNDSKEDLFNSWMESFISKWIEEKKKIYRNMEQLQDVQEYSANNVASSLGADKNDNLFLLAKENIFLACIYIILFFLSTRILVRAYYPSMLQHAEEIWMLTKYDLNNGKESMEEFKNMVRGHLKTCKFYILNVLDTILGVIIRKLKSTHEGVQNVQRYATQDISINSCYGHKHGDDPDDENDDDYDEEDDVDGKNDADEFHDCKDDSEEQDKNQNDSMEKGLSDSSMTNVNSDMESEGSNDSLPKVGLENTPEDEPKDSSTKENDEDMIIEKTEEKSMKNTQDANKEGTADNDVKENIIEKKNEKDGNTNEEVKRDEHVTIERDTKGQSKSGTGEELKLKKGGPSKHETGGLTKWEKIGPSKQATGTVVKSATRSVVKSDASAVSKSDASAVSKSDASEVSKSDASAVVKSDANVVAKSDASAVVKSDASAVSKSDANVVAKSATSSVVKSATSAVAKSDASGVAKRDTTGVPKRETSGQENLKKNEQTKGKTNEELINTTQETSAGINPDKGKKILNLKNVIPKDKESGDKGVNFDKSDKNELTEEWKVNEWNKWMRQLEEQWHFFFIGLETKTDDWMKEKEKDLQTWITEMETKWMNYNHNFDIEYNTNLYKKYLMWDPNDWKTWIRTVGKRLMENDWIKWVEDHESKLNEWVNYDWFQWKSLKNSNWVMNEWKIDEHEYWEEWQNSNLTLWLQKKKRKKYLTWKNRIEREKSEWDSWVQSKEKLISKSKTGKWIKWKNEKRLLFNDWMENFINTWINRKQWNSWIIERRDVLSRRASSSY